MSAISVVGGYCTGGVALCCGPEGDEGDAVVDVFVVVEAVDVDVVAEVEDVEAASSLGLRSA